MKKVKLFEEFIGERLSMDAVYIHQITGSGQDSAQNFIDDNNIDSAKLVAYLKQHKDSKEKYDVRDMISGTNKNKRFMKQFVNESKEVFPNEIVGNDQILFKKEWEKMNGGKLAAKYNQYYKGYDIDAGGRIFNSVDQLEKYIKATELSNNQYNQYKNMPEKPIGESVVNEDAPYSVTKNTYRDYDSLNITQYDSIQFKEDGNKWIVRCVTAHDNIDKNALQKLGFGNSGSTRYAGIDTYTKNANWNDLELTKKQFDELVKIVDAGWASHAKAFADFYKNRQAD